MESLFKHEKQPGLMPTDEDNLQNVYVQYVEENGHRFQGNGGNDMGGVMDQTTASSEATIPNSTPLSGT